MEIHYVRQKAQNGIWDEIRYTQNHEGNQSLALLLRDFFIKSTVPWTANLIEHAKRPGLSVNSLERVHRAGVYSYGVADITAMTTDSGSFGMTDFVGKPPRKDLLLNLAITVR